MNTYDRKKDHFSGRDEVVFFIFNFEKNGSFAEILTL